MRKYLISAISTASIFAASQSHAVPVDLELQLLDDSASANEFADVLASFSRFGAGGSTSPKAGLTGAGPLFASNQYEAARQVIDVVSDGAENVALGCGQPVFDCPSLQAARDAAIDEGIDQINALLIDDGNLFGDDPEDLIDAVPYAQTTPIAGEGSFATLIQAFESFAPAIESKMIRGVLPVDPTPPKPEVPPIPASAPVLLLGGALFSLRAMRRRKTPAPV